MSYRFVKCQKDLGWDWYLESDDCLSWVSQPTKEAIESLEAENAKLRNRLSDLHDAAPTSWHYGAVVSENMQLEDENAKLRELVRDMRKAFFTLDIDHCQACPRDTINGPCTKHHIGGSDECNFEEEMRDLGIEVDG